MTAGHRVDSGFSRDGLTAAAISLSRADNRTPSARYDDAAAPRRPASGSIVVSHLMVSRHDRRCEARLLSPSIASRIRSFAGGESPSPSSSSTATATLHRKGTSPQRDGGREKALASQRLSCREAIKWLTTTLPDGGRLGAAASSNPREGAPLWNLVSEMAAAVRPSLEKPETSICPAVMRVDGRARGHQVHTPFGSTHRWWLNPQYALPRLFSSISRGGRTVFFFFFFFSCANFIEILEK